MSEAEFIQDQAGKIISSGVLGRSKTNLRLFNYLVERSINGLVPKELEIAIDVFHKGAEFDVGHDSIVRVYIYKLRQKIDDYYLNHGVTGTNRISIPKGQYRFAVTPIHDGNTQVITPVDKDAGVMAVKKARNWLYSVLIISLIINAILLSKFSTDTPNPSTINEQVTQHAIWASILDDDLPITIVLGDYYIFAELDEAANVSRLVRDFSINSHQDLENLLMDEPDLFLKYLNVDLNYLPVASAFALRDILPVLQTSGKTIDVMMMSEFNVAELKSSHIIYIGYISAMDKLTEFVFASSGLAIADTYDELTNLATGDTYYSEAGILPFDNTNYRDYGLFSTFPGPNGNQIVVVSGTRDEGLMQTAHAVTTPAYLQVIDQALPEINNSTVPAFEALYEVTGLDRTNLDAMLLFTSMLDYRTIWGGELPGQ